MGTFRFRLCLSDQRVVVGNIDLLASGIVDTLLAWQSVAHGNEISTVGLLRVQSAPKQSDRPRCLNLAFELAVSIASQATGLYFLRIFVVLGCKKPARVVATVYELKFGLALELSHFRGKSKSWPQNGFGGLGRASYAHLRLTLRVDFKSP